jgi:Delta7-sterol 5-desaturase
MLGYVLFHRKWLHRKIIQARPSSAQVRREISHSLLTLVIFGIVGLLTMEAARRGWTQMYWRVQDHSWAWWWASVGLTILLHDTWFYWTHRAMHHRKLFRHFHSTHHLFTNPTPWAAFAFSPGEALVQAAIFPLVVTVMPIHPLAFGLFMI